MIASHLKFAWRHLTHNRQFSVLNLVGLLTGTDIGFNKDNVVYFEIEGKTATNADAFLDGLRQVPGVIRAQTSLVVRLLMVLPGMTTIRMMNCISTYSVCTITCSKH